MKKITVYKTLVAQAHALNLVLVKAYLERLSEIGNETKTQYCVSYD